MKVHDELVVLFREVLDNDELVLADHMTAHDIPGWDSVMHINLMFGIEEKFGIKFKGNELAEFKNIGELTRFLAERSQVGKDTSA